MVNPENLGKFFWGQNVTRGKLQVKKKEVIFEGVQTSKLMIPVNQT